MMRICFPQLSCLHFSCQCMLDRSLGSLAQRHHHPRCCPCCFGCCLFAPPVVWGSSSDHLGTEFSLVHHSCNQCYRIYHLQSVACFGSCVRIFVICGSSGEGILFLRFFGRQGLKDWLNAVVVANRMESCRIFGELGSVFCLMVCWHRVYCF